MALGDAGGGVVVVLASEKGRKGGESSSSSSASERGLRGALLDEYRGRRGANARLRDMGCGVSESDEEELDDELAIAEGLAFLSRERRFSFGGTSMDLREVSRLLLAKDDCLSAGGRGEEEGESFWI